MKNKIKLILALSALCSLAGCSNCTHNYEITNTIDPTKDSSGSREYTCTICNNKYTQELPKLDDKNYTISTQIADCTHDGGTLYSSNDYGTYLADITQTKLGHTNYDGECSRCLEMINNFTFKSDTIVKVNKGGSAYPRLCVLENTSGEEGCFLCVFENSNKCYVKRSYDEGKTWQNIPVVASFHDEVTCANPFLFEAKDGTIYCGYRALGRSSDQYARNIYCSVSYDGGYTFEDFDVVEDIYDLGYSVSQVHSAVSKHSGIGFYEPFIGYINDKIVCMYADDATPMLEDVRKNVSLNYECQRIITKELVDGHWTNRKIIMDGAVMKKVNGTLNFSRDGMPEFCQLSDGTYVLVFEGTYRRATSEGSNPFEILISYSKDGETWSNPVEVYQPHGNTTKASAPYISRTEDDRLVISFQTDEDCYAAGKGIGDGVSIMKCMISDGTKVEDITKDNFFEAQNVFNKQPGQQSVWTGHMLYDGAVYCVAGDGNILINSCKVPLLDQEN